MTRKIAGRNRFSLREKAVKRLPGQGYVPDMPYDLTGNHTVLYQLDGGALIGEAEPPGASKNHQYWPKEQLSGRPECLIEDDREQISIDYMDCDSQARNNKAASSPKHKVASNRARWQYSNPVERHRAELSQYSEL